MFSTQLWSEEYYKSPIIKFIELWCELLSFEREEKCEDYSHIVLYIQFIQSRVYDISLESMKTINIQIKCIIWTFVKIVYEWCEAFIGGIASISVHIIQYCISVKHNMMKRQPCTTKLQAFPISQFTLLLLLQKF